MKILLNLLLLLPFFANSQTNTTGPAWKMFYYDTTQNCSQHRMYEHVEQMPSYKNGLSSLEKELNAALKPVKGAKYLMRLFFTVNCEGKAYGFHSVNGKDSIFDANLIKSMQQLQNWQAGKQRGIIVDCGYVLVLDIKRGKIIIRDKRD